MFNGSCPTCNTETDPAIPLPATKAFECVFTAATQQVKVSDFCTLDCHLPFDQAVIRLKEFDILIIPGGETAEIITTKSQPLQLIKAFADLQIKYPNKERTLMSVGTGSLLLAHQGILSGLSATTHPDYLAKMEIICTQASQRDLSERPNVLEERYVVNNLRFDLGNPDESIYQKKVRWTKAIQRKKRFECLERVEYQEGI